MSGRGKNKQREDQTYRQTQQAYSDYRESPLEKRLNARTMKFLDQFEGATDVKDIEAVSPYYDIYNQAKSGQENSRVGTGLFALGGDTNESGHAHQLQQQMQSEKEQNAAGQLYNATNDAYNSAMGQSQFLIGADQSRKAAKLGASNQLYSTLLNRPRSTPWWQVALGIGQQAAQAYAGAA